MSKLTTWNLALVAAVVLSRSGGINRSRESVTRHNLCEIELTFNPHVQGSSGTSDRSMINRLNQALLLLTREDVSMTANEMNVARYIRERSEELRKLSRDARLDLLVHIFGVAALEATKHEDYMAPPMVPTVDNPLRQAIPRDNDAVPCRAALLEVLEGLVGVAVKRSEGEARAAFYVADEVGRGLHRVAGMTTAYGAYTAGFKIGTQSLACGLAAAIRRPVITDDIRKDPTWRDWEWLAAAFNYRGCWSFPIEGRGGKIFGTFSMYFKNPSQATDRDLQFASFMTDTAAEIIGRRGLN
jgi:GAF domain